jgi:NAD+ kinase
VAQLKNICIVLKPKASIEFEFILPNLVSWLNRRKKTIFFIDKEKERLTKMLKGEAKNVNYLTEE